MPLSPQPFSGWAQKVHGVCFALFLIQFAFDWVRMWLPLPRLSQAQWPDGLLLVLATATTLASLSRQLPGQNVALAAFIIAFIAGAAQSLGAVTGMPFGPYRYDYDHIGQQLFYPLPGAVPLIWMVTILNCRGVARLMLRPWRQKPNYGFWLIGLSVVLTVLFDLAFEPFATQIKHYWTWKQTRIPVDWYSTPLTNFLGWGVTALLILAFVTPSLINKKPVKPPPPQYHPLIVWLLLQLLFLTGATIHHFWAAAGLILGLSLVVAFLAVRAARR
ncbi:MAG TPA: carotenoid biosynthesis protein [Bacillota bacterium]|nr:carotenoid biosynthesis protein [Bacillota bacterium]